MRERESERSERAALRLGVYVDATYEVGDDEVAGIAADPVDAPFLLFASEVGRRFAKLVLFGRARPRALASRWVALPAEAELVPLPHYESLRELRRVVASSASTSVAFWRGLSAVDVVWVFGPHPFSLLLVALALARGRRVVLGVRQDTIAYYRSRLPSGRWTPVLLAALAVDGAYRSLGRWLRTTAVGSEVARRYASGRAPVLPITVSLVRREQIPSVPPSRDWGGAIELLTIGRIEPEKNPFLMLDALARLERQRPGRYVLTWLGHGRLEKDVRTRARELGVEHLITFRGHVPFGPEVLASYRRAHLFVHVSRTEALPQVLVEALASGTPIVATDVGGVAAALDGGAAGLLVPPADAEALARAIMRLTDDEQLREHLTRRGLELARSVALEDEAERIARFLSVP